MTIFQKSNTNGLLLLWIFCILFASCKKDDAEISQDDEPITDDEPIDDDPNPGNENALAIEWVKTFGGSGEEDAASVKQTADGGYIILGYTTSTDGDIVDKSTSDNDLWVLKLSSDGNIQWSKTYGGSNDERGTDIINTSDGGYAMAGYTRSDDGDISENAGFYDYWIVKLNSQGDIQWEKTYGFPGNDQANSLLQTSDGGYFITGFLDVTASGGAGNDNRSSGNRHGVGEFWAIKTDAQGEYEWRRYFGGTNNDRPYDVIEAENGDFIMVGNSESVDFDITDPKGSYDFWAVRITEIGDLVWAKNYGGSNIDIAYNITPTSDGNYLIIGDSRSGDQDVSQNYGNADAWLIKIDNNGNLLWEKSYGGSQFDTARSIVELENGTIFAAGSSRSNDVDVAENYGQSDCWAFITSANGELLWEQNIGGSMIEFANASIKTTDNTIVVVGNSESNDIDIPENKGSKDVMIIKLNKQN